jgi:hypothetical protein
MDTASWPRAAEAAKFFEHQFHSFSARNPMLADMATRFRDHAGVSILNLVDHWVLPRTDALEYKLAECGLRETMTEDGDPAWEHPAARLPRVRLDEKIDTPDIALAVDDVAWFAEQNNLSEPSVGDPGSRYEVLRYALCQGHLLVVARRGYRGFRPGMLSILERDLLEEIQQAFRGRNRAGGDTQVIESLSEQAQRAVDSLGKGRATDEFFAAEREFYVSRNDAARWQFERQQEIGIGWANHDHHTYRTARASFRDLMHLWQAFGFIARERFYAGAEAGWGAQIMEHPSSRIVIFADVDVMPEELDIDFAAVQLPPSATLGTIGLWCALHGSSIAAAGMHHLECEFDFVRAQANFERAGFPVMAPFTDLPMLRQAFTQAQVWPVDAGNLEALQARGAITPEQAARFLAQGAPGSHLEILQRWDGFKGFNKTGVSAIIRDTDARRVA